MISLRWMTALALSLLLCLGGRAEAANNAVGGGTTGFTVTVVIAGPSSTGSTCIPSTVNISLPWTPGIYLCSIAVVPTGWSGLIVLSDPTHFSTAMVVPPGGSLPVLSLVTGATALTAGTYAVTGTPSP